MEWISQGPRGLPVYLPINLYWGWSWHNYPIIITDNSTSIISQNHTKVTPQSWYIEPGWWFQPLWTIWKSVGMIIPNIWKQMFQTTNQITIWECWLHWAPHDSQLFWCVVPMATPSHPGVTSLGRVVWHDPRQQHAQFNGTVLRCATLNSLGFGMVQGFFSRTKRYFFAGASNGWP